jgi:heptosyltransferase II
MKILVRLPNWLGDMVMSVGFIKQLDHFFPGAEVSIIAKEGIHELLPLFPGVKNVFIFSKKKYKGLKGLLKFGREIRNTEQFDLFFSLPNSFSSAVIGFASGARKRIGYKQELRQILLTDSFQKPTGIHRAEEYVRLLEQYTGKKALVLDVSMRQPFQKNRSIVVNINSEASSRRLTISKAIQLLSDLRKNLQTKIILIGTSKEKAFVDEVLSGLPDKNDVVSMAGCTSLPQLADVLGSASLMLTTDSGPAHLANALGTHTIVLFGAGNESHTAPYNQLLRSIIRLGKLSCEPCQRNVCLRFTIPECLEQLDNRVIINEVKRIING